MSSPLHGHGGGAERVMADIANNLVKRGHAVDFLVNRANPNCWSMLLSREVNFHVLNTHRSTMLFGLLRYIARERPDAMLSTLRSGNFATLTAKKFFFPNLRTVNHWAHFLSTKVMDFVPHPRMTQLAMITIKLLLSTSNTVVVLNEGMAVSMRTQVPKARVRVIPDPLDIDQIVAKAKCSIDHPWLMDGHPPVIVTVSRLHPVKDIPTLLFAFKKVLEDREARLIVVGEGPELQRLIGLADQLGIANSVDFLGFKDNPFPYMAQADVFAVSSISEGSCTVLMQAIALGTPVVSTDCDYGPSDVLMDGKLGYLTLVGDAEALATSILSTLSHPPVSKDQLIAGAQRYAIESVMDQYEDVLRLI